MSLPLKDHRTSIDEATDMWLEDDEYRPFRLDGKTEEEFHAEPLPEQITIPLRKEAAAILAAMAYSEDRTPEYIAARILFELAQKKIKRSAEIIAGISAQQPPKSESIELGYQRQLLSEMIAAGLDARTQVPTHSGIADLVVLADGKPIVVVELKASLKKRREVLHASGQARAYAEALSAPHCMVSAPEIAPELLNPIPGAVAVYMAGSVIPVIKEFVGG